MEHESLKLTVGPTQEPITIEDAKEYMRIDEDQHGDDFVITRNIEAARRVVENFTGRSMLTQTWRQRFDQFPSGDAFELPKPPLATVTSIQYVDIDGNTQTVGTAVYNVLTDPEPGLVELAFSQTWPSTRDQREAVTILFDAGNTNQASVDEGLKHGVRWMTSHLTENREPLIVGTIVAEIPLGLKDLLWPYRIEVVG